MDKLQVDQIDNDVLIKFNPEWMECIGEFITYLPKVRVNQLVVEGQVLASMETSRCIATIKAPMNAKIISIERNVVDDPHNKILFIFKSRP